MPGDATVVREALVDNDQLARLLGERVVIQREHAADRDEVILLRREDRRVREQRDLPDQLGERLLRVARLAVLDEERVLRDPGRVEDERHSVLECQPADSGEVGERERLPAGHVQAGLHAHERDAFGRGGREHLLEGDQIDVALEQVRRLGVARLRDRDVDPDAARELDVRARGREVEVGRHEQTGLDEQLREQVLGAATLVGRDDMPVAVQLPHRLLEPVEAARARVRLVAELHRGALLLRERGRAAVGEEVDEDVVRAEQERVVAGGFERTPALRLRPERDRLDDLDLPGRRERTHAR